MAMANLDLLYSMLFRIINCFNFLLNIFQFSSFFKCMVKYAELYSFMELQSIDLNLNPTRNNVLCQTISKAIGY